MKTTFTIKNRFDWASLGCGRRDIIDAAINYAIWGVDPRQYICNEFYKKSFKEKRSFMTITEGKRIEYKLKKSFTREEFLSIANKYVFNKTYSKYVHREYLLSENSRKEDLLSFISRNKKILVKELCNTQGKGIRLVKSDDPNLDKTIEEIVSGSYVLESTYHMDSRIERTTKGDLSYLSRKDALLHGNSTELTLCIFSSINIKHIRHFKAHIRGMRSLSAYKKTIKSFVLL